MPHYISLMRWTTAGRAGLPAWRDRVEDGERLIQEAGGTLVGVYVTLGRYDVVEVFEAPDDATALNLFVAKCRGEMDQELGAGEAEHYAFTAGLNLSFLGLARYLRKRTKASA